MKTLASAAILFSFLSSAAFANTIAIDTGIIVDHFSTADAQCQSQVNKIQQMAIPSISVKMNETENDRPICDDSACDNIIGWQELSVSCDAVLTSSAGTLSVVSTRIKKFSSCTTTLPHDKGANTVLENAYLDYGFFGNRTCVIDSVSLN